MTFYLFVSKMREIHNKIENKIEKQKQNTQLSIYIHSASVQIINSDQENPKH